MRTKESRMCRNVRAKFIRLQNNGSSSVKVEKYIYETFNIVQGFKQLNALSCDLFNFDVESVIRKAGEHRQGTFVIKYVQLFASTYQVRLF